MAKIGDLLVEQGKISRRDMEKALLAQQEMGGLIGHVLIRLGLVSEQDLATALSQQLNVPLIAANDFPETPIYLEAVSPEFLVSNLVVPVTVDDHAVTLAAAVPQDRYLNKALSMALDRSVVMTLGLEGDINRALELYLQEKENDAQNEEFDVATSEGEYDDEFVEHLKDLASEAPVIRLLNQLILKAVELSASDIHIEPFDDGLHVRYRVDGVLQDDVDPPSAKLAAALASRIKLLARLNIAERRLPQDGRIMMRVRGHELDLRVSTSPTVHGESIVMRILDRENIRLSLTSMGFHESTRKEFSRLLEQPHGILLVTGPTGSGKTTTLYAALSSINAAASKVITVEDPVEYQLRGVNQIQVQADIEFSFARALRSVLRQDPDIIMIGEMRDKETAQIAVQSALTGHLVLSTLHTNTAAGAIIRLEDMGVERYLITSSVNAVLSQRLVRKLCSHCRQELAIGDIAGEVRRYMPEGTGSVYRAVGCEACQGTGYQGRTAIHELLTMKDQLQKATIAGADASSLHKLARELGMTTLYEDGLRKVAEGLTSLEEVLRVTQDQSDN